MKNENVQFKLNRQCKQKIFPVKDPSHGGEIRRLSAVWGEELKFDEVTMGKISIVINELTSNILKHAGQGEIVCTKNQNSLELLSIDQGPGMKNVQECLRDGVSTMGTSGTGLGAIKRLSSNFDIYTLDGRGTLVWCSFGPSQEPSYPYQIHSFQQKQKKNWADVAGIYLPYKGEIDCGDQWAYKEEFIEGKIHLKILVADGLGHGKAAYEAAKKATENFHSMERKNPFEEIESIHHALKGTRGAAASVVDIDLENKSLDCCGLGNISVRLQSYFNNRGLISYNGIAGVQFQKTKSLSYPMLEEDYLIMTSDGISTHWNLQNYPGIFLKHPALLAGILYRDFCRHTDDATVVVLRRTV